MKFFLLNFVVSLVFCFTSTAQDWHLTGNADATAGSKLGTTSAIPLGLYTGNVQRLSITAAGNIGMGTTNPLEKLHVFQSSSRSVIQIGSYGFTGTMISSVDF